MKVGILSVARHDGGRSVKLTRRRTRALPLAFPALAVASVAVFLLLTAFPSAASAQPEPEVRTLATPTITSPVDGAFLGSAGAVITGTKAAGSEIQILAGTSRTNVCTIRSAATDYTCAVSRLPSGPAIRLTAVQLVSGEKNVESDPVRVDVLAPPTIAGTSPLLTGGLVQGGGYPDAQITLSVTGGSSWTFPAGADGTWAYVLPRELGSGTYTLTASQSTPFSHGSQSDSSASRTISLDVDAPSAPTVTSPASGSTIARAGAKYSGTGENGATVNVFALTESGADVALCSAVVSGGVWQCTGSSLPAGTFTVTAFQTDAVGNPGAGSAPLTVTVAKPATASPAPVPSPSPTEDDTVAPVAPPAPSPTPTPAPVAPPEPAAPEAQTPGPGNWEAATPFTKAVPSALRAADLSWLRALVLAAVAILLLLVPARMLATTVGARRSTRSPLNLTGRNRVPTHDDPAPVLTGPGERVTSVLVVVVAAAIVLFANPVHGEAEYVRVLLASVVALAAINLVATSIPALLATRLAAGPARVALSPRLLLSVAAVALVSRTLDLQPALLFGIVFTVTAVSGTRAARGIVAGIRIGAVFTAGILAWLASTLLDSPGGFFGSLLAETANIAAMAGVGSAAVLLIPLGKMDGRALLVWSRPAWFLLAVVVLTVLFALLAPVVDVWQTSGDILVGFLLVLGFGAVGLSLWIWRRLIQPALTAD